MKIENTLDIAASVASVWAATIDIEGLPSLTPTVTSVERLDTGPLAVGSKARLKQPAQGAKVWTVTHMDTNQYFAWETKIAGCCMIGSHALTPTDAGCRNHIAITITGFGSGLLSRLAGASIRKALATENAGFARVAAARDKATAT
jgi:hypothetical protein